MADTRHKANAVSSNAVPESPDAIPGPRARRKLRLEPTVELEWSQAIELPRFGNNATSPAENRRAWVHRAPEEHVLTLYRTMCACGGTVPSPWWLRAIAAGSLESRAAGFRIEDGIATLLANRSGWEYVPWTLDGESGYWEFMPSERASAGHAIPTTISNTDRHPGWIDMVPAHTGIAPRPIAVNGLGDLRERLAEFESAH